MKQKCKYLSRRGLLKPYSKRRRVRLKQMRRYATTSAINAHRAVDSFLSMLYGGPGITPLVCRKENYDTMFILHRS